MFQLLSSWDIFICGRLMQVTEGISTPSTCLKCGVVQILLWYAGYSWAYQLINNRETIKRYASSSQTPLYRILWRDFLPLVENTYLLKLKELLVADKSAITDNKVLFPWKKQSKSWMNDNEIDWMSSSKYMFLDI